MSQEIKLIEKRDQTVSESIKTFSDSIPKVQRQIWAEMLTLLKSLDIDSEGRVKSTTANLKLVNTFTHIKLKKIVKATDYQQAVKEFTNSFSVIAKQTEDYFKSVDNA